YFVLILWRVFCPQIECGGLAFGASKSAHGGNRQKLTATFAVGNDATDTEVVFENFDGIADLLSGGGVVVEDDIVGSLKGRTREKRERQKRIEAFEIDAVDAVKRAVDLDIDRSCDDNVGNLCKNIGYFDRG